jgi:hypothetical protein
MSYPQAQHTMCKSNYNKTLSNRYQVVINLLALRERVALALGVYAGRIQQTQALTISQQNEVLSVLKDKEIKINKRLMFIVSALVAMQGIDTASAANHSIDHLKLYAHSRLLNYDQFICFNKIITKESRWSYTARNGSHYGLGQMRSTWYRDLDAYRQIDATIRYVHKRYTTSCNAWTFHMKHGYY